MQEHRAQVQHVTPARSDEVVHLLARAFDDDPWMNFLAKQDARRQDRIRYGFRRTLHLALPFDEVYATADGHGAAVWFPPTEPPSGWRDHWTATTGTWRAMARKAGLERLPRVLRARGALFDAHPAESHWELRAIGVDAERRGSGLATALIAPMLERVDSEGALTVLTCTKARNIALYRRFGFEVTAEVPVTGDVRLWVMTRPPRPHR